MNFLSLFVLIPLLMMLGLWIARDMKQIRTVAVIGSTILLALSVYTLVEFLAERVPCVWIWKRLRCLLLVFTIIFLLEHYFWYPTSR